eukprot:m.706433 g.706433  ORF g.706433 m.706433 type:complete len:827 (+) comp22932_c0_seq5:8-2488(+)
MRISSSVLKPLTLISGNKNSLLVMSTTVIRSMTASTMSFKVWYSYRNARVFGQMVWATAFLVGCSTGTRIGGSLAPVMGWRSWYAFSHEVTQLGMEQSMAIMRNRSRMVDGKPTSLWDVGYTHVGLDDGYQACGTGVNGSFHDAQGTPLMNISRFPNITAMVERAHALDMEAGFYVNNYICGEHGSWTTPAEQDIHMRGTTAFIADNQFDLVKIDSGGHFNDMEWWYTLLNASGRSVLISNCHQGHIIPNATWCPFDFFKTSGDPAVVGWEFEMLVTSSMLHLSRPSCWAYPGYAAYSAAMGDYNNSRAQFAVHAIVSSPLMLSFDLRDDARLDSVWDIITNTEAIRVNQQWAGSAGTLLRRWQPQSTNTSAPLYAWAVHCPSSKPAHEAATTAGVELVADVDDWVWTAIPRSQTQPPRIQARETSTHQIQCLSTPSGSSGFSLVPCSDTDRTQDIALNKKGQLVLPLQYLKRQSHRLKKSFGHGATLQMIPCNHSDPTQQWTVNTSGAVTNIKSVAAQACIEIVACSTADGATINTNFGCKPLPSPGSTDPCDKNGAWLVNSDNHSITSLLDGKCLSLEPNGASVTVTTCAPTGSPSAEKQLWTLSPTDASVLIQSGLHGDGATPMCLADVPLGECVTVDDNSGGTAAAQLVGPELLAADCGQGGDMQTFRITATGRLMADVTPDATLSPPQAQAICVVPQHGVPDKYGPMQMWAKPQLHGASAVVVLNLMKPSSRSTTSTGVAVSIDFASLPFGDVRVSSTVNSTASVTRGTEGFLAPDKYRVRDIHAKHDVPNGPFSTSFTTDVIAPGDSRFYLISKMDDAHV